MQYVLGFRSEETRPSSVYASVIKKTRGLLICSANFETKMKQMHYQANILNSTFLIHHTHISFYCIMDLLDLVSRGTEHFNFNALPEERFTCRMLHGCSKCKQLHKLSLDIGSASLFSPHVAYKYDNYSCTY